MLAELQRDRRDQEQPDEDVHGEQRAEKEDRHALDREQNEQDDRRPGGQPLVALGRLALREPHAAKLTGPDERLMNAVHPALIACGDN